MTQDNSRSSESSFSKMQRPLVLNSCRSEERTTACLRTKKYPLTRHNLHCKLQHLPRSGLIQKHSHSHSNRSQSRRHGARRSSQVSSDSGHDRDRRKSSVYDIDGLRRKLQRETIEHHGLHSVQLWSAATEALSLARTIFSRKPRHDSVTIGGYQFSSEYMLNSPGQVASSSLAHITVRNPAPRTPRPQNGTSKGETSAERLTEGLAAQANRYDDPAMPLKFPVRVWTNIIRQTADPHEVLSAAQMERIVAYARDWDTLTKEREMLHKDPSTQKWMVMEAMGCLSYETMS